jgi:DNA-binding winged helix-turn-helix (wHTH) protein/Tol biopolymer transport system component
VYKPSDQYFSFADFEIDAGRRLLLRQGMPVALSSKAFDLLLALVRNHGEVLSKDELMSKVWEGQFVEEGNLTVHISTLRKLLGEGKKEHRFIVTIPGRGYRFVAPVITTNDDVRVVESHTIRRVIVEEEFDENDPETLPEQRVLHLPGAATAVDWFRQYRWLIAVGSFLFFALLVFGAFSILQRRFSHNPEPFQQISVRRLTSKGMVSNAALSPDGKLFVYSLLEGENQSLWIGQVGGGEPVMIRPAASVVYTNLKFTPDGKSVWYVLSENLGEGALYKIPVLGGVPEKVADRFHGFTVSPDGKEFAYIGRNGDASVVMTSNNDTTGERQLISLPDEPETTWHVPTWSPDGKKMALAAELPKEVSQLRILDLVNGDVATLGNRTWRSIRSIVWMHDQTGLFLVVVDDTTSLRQVWYVSYPDGAAKRVTPDLTGYDLLSLSIDDKNLMAVNDVNQSNIWVAPSEKLADAKQITFGPVGRSDGWNGLVWNKNDKIVYTAVTSTGDSIWIMNANGSDQKQTVVNGGSSTYPSLSDDGRYLVFQSDRGGHNGVWRMDFETDGLSPLTGDEVSVEPYISPDGKWVVYRSGAFLWRISAEGGAPVQLTERAAGWPQISPDSKLVACEADVDGKTRLGIFSLETGQLIKDFERPRLANLRLGVHWTPDGASVAYRDWANGIWKQDLIGGPPQRLEGLPEEKFFGFGWSRDGKKFAFSRGGTSRDVILLTASSQ